MPNSVPLSQSALLVVDAQDSFKIGPRWQRRNNFEFEANTASLIEAYRAAELPIIFFLHVDEDEGFEIASPHSRDLTRSLRILGTPLYMAPERIRSPGDVDARADIYSVGVVAFYLLTGMKLFESENDLELAQRVLNDPPPRPSTVAPGLVPAELDLLVAACLAKRREERPQSAMALLETLDALAVENRWAQAQAAACWA